MWYRVVVVGFADPTQSHSLFLLIRTAHEKQPYSDPTSMRTQPWKGTSDGLVLPLVSELF